MKTLPLNWGGPRNGEHMPFSGHRTQEQVRLDHEAAVLRANNARARAYGFDPEALAK